MSNKFYMIYYTETMEPVDEIFSSPEKAVEYLKLQNGVDYIYDENIFRVDNNQKYRLLYEEYVIMEKQVDPNPTLYLGPSNFSGSIPVHFEFERARMIEVRRKNNG